MKRLTSTFPLSAMLMLPARIAAWMAALPSDPYQNKGGCLSELFFKCSTSRNVALEIKLTLINVMDSPLPHLQAF